MILAELLALVATAALLGVAGYRLARRGPRWALGLTLAGLLGPLLAWLPKHLPLLYAMPQPVGITGELLMTGGFLAVGAGAAHVGHLRVGRILVCLIAVLGHFLAAQSHWSLLLHGPLCDPAHARATDTHVLQTTPSSCAAACAATLLRLHGVDVGEAEMARRCRTSLWGTSALSLIRGIREASVAHGRPLHPRIQRRDPADPAALATLPVPAIVFIVDVRSGVRHVGVYQGPVPGRPGAYFLADPVHPDRRVVTPDELRARYDWDGRALTVAKP